MAIRRIFFDIGGVLLTNAWDSAQRARVLGDFGVEVAAFDLRHHSGVDDLETGRITLDEYLDRVLFYQARSFAREPFIAAMKAQSEPLAGMLEFVRALRRTLAGAAVGGDGPRLCTLNNESRELNEYRIDTFGLRDLFDGFLSSCYLGTAKPDPAIFRAALDFTRSLPGECVLVDDRATNVEAARALGFHAIQHRELTETRLALEALGLPVPPDQPEA